MRQFVFLMKFTNGAMSFDGIMNLTFTQFFSLLDATTYWLNAESEKGQKANKAKDQMSEYKDLNESGEKEDIIAKVRQFKKDKNLSANTSDIAWQKQEKSLT